MGSAVSARCLLAMCVVLPTARFLPGQVTIDADSRFQTMQGFGSSLRIFDDPHVFDNFDPKTARAMTVLTTAQQDAVLDRLYTDLRLTWVRPITEGDIEPVNDNDNPDVTDLSKFNFAWKRNDAHVEYVRRAAARGAKNFFLSALRRESWMKVNTPNDVAEYAEWCLAMIRRWRTLGLELPYFSLANEPANSMNFMTGPFMRDVIKKMGPKLRAEGFTTKFVISDDLNPSRAAERCSVILSDREARQYVGALASHLYGEPVGSMAHMRALAEQYRLPLWMTEFSRGEAGMSALEYAERVIHPLITEYNVSVHLYMWGFFGQWEAPIFHLLTLKHNGAVYTGYEADQMYYVLGQFSRFVLPGAVRVKAESANAAVKVTAYVDKETLTIVAINNTDQRIDERFTIRNLSGLTAVQAVRTSAAENMAALPALAVTRSEFTATLAPRSITTFTSRAAAAVVNGASLLPGPVAPGQAVTVFGTQLGPERAVEGGFSSDGVLGTTLGATRLLFDNIAAPLLYVSERQVSAIAPYSVGGRTSTRLQLESGGRTAEIANVSVAEAFPGIFTVTGTGQGQGAILNQDATTNSASNPAPRGSVVSIFATGEGETNPRGQDGKSASAPLPAPLLPVSVRIGDEPAEVLYAGAAPAFAGLMQINARVPALIVSGPAVPIVLFVGDARSQSGVTLAVQ